MNVMEKEARNIIITGTFSGSEEIDSDLITEKAIEILICVAKEDPGVLLAILIDAVEIRMDSMVMLGLAVLTGHADSHFLSSEKNAILDILCCYGPPKLLDYVELLRTKTFGRGFGTRPQKWIRSVMEFWGVNQVRYFRDANESAFYDLVKLVHPRYYHKRGKIILHKRVYH